MFGQRGSLEYCLPKGETLGEEGSWMFWCECLVFDFPERDTRRSRGRQPVPFENPTGEGMGAGLFKSTDVVLAQTEMLPF